MGRGTIVAVPFVAIPIFVAISAAAAGVQLVCLWVSHDVTGWTGALADNLSANVIGMGLATVLGFWGFRTLVFRGPGRRLSPLGLYSERCVPQ